MTDDGQTTDNGRRMITIIQWSFGACVLTKQVFNHTSGVTVVTPTDRPKSVRNRSLSKFLVAFFVLSACFLNFSVGVGILSKD